MAIFSWNEIRDRAIRFSNEWKNEYSENAEAKTFWNEFFNIFGISRRRVATFEEKVKTLDGICFIDLLWKGVLLVEHKSRGRDLDRAYKQAKDYFPGLKESELPKYILVSDFEKFALYDLEADSKRTFTLDKLHENIELFGFIAGYQKQEYKEQDPVNIEAAEKMGELHDNLKEIGYVGHELEVYLVRLLFCLFADDTGIFEKNIFRDYIEQHTREDGSDLAFHLDAIFETLNKPREARLKTISESLNHFPYVNGQLFEERLPLASFNKKMRDLFLDCCALNWGQISPAIFGSMFQSVMKPEERRELGAHYTSEKNIMKVIKPLFLDELSAEFEAAKGSKRKLEQLHNKIAELKFLDPACGCGNFLIIAYRELRQLEIDILKELTKGEFQRIAFLEHLIKVDVDQFYGIEIDEFPAQIAQVALWLMDHQMNMKASLEFGEYFVRLPLKTKPNIVNANALTLDWNTLIPSSELDYILGNPPFVGSGMMTAEQKADMSQVTKEIKRVGQIDFVACWFIKAANYIQSSFIKVGLVSTNSIIQGDQAIRLWKHLFEEKGITINFAHQTFKWTNEARGKAAVYCVIIGFSKAENKMKLLFEYPDIKGEPIVKKVKNINEYLLDAPTIFIDSRPQPVCDVPHAIRGNTLVDGGHLIINDDELDDFLAKEPLVKKYIKKLMGSREYINNLKRWCLWLVDCPPNELRQMKHVLERVQKVKEFRENAKDASARRVADRPTLFREQNNPDSYVIIPRVSSERRKFVPMGFLNGDIITADSCIMVPDATIYHFGVLISTMHMAWLRVVGGRLKSDYRYSVNIVYNNFIWPEANEKQQQEIEHAAYEILDIRKKYPNSSLADLYDPIAMPSDLAKAHAKLDKAVEKSYGKTFKSDAERVAHLFDLYASMQAKK